MKQFFLPFLLLSLFFIGFPQKTFADYSAQDGDIIASLKISDIDAKIASLSAGQPVTLTMNFVDKTERFTIGTCKCTLTIAEPGKLPSSQPLTLQNSNGPDVPYTTVSYVFPTAETYTINVTGQPKKPGTFAPFSVSWQVKVNPNSHFQTQKRSSSSKRPYLFGGIVVACLLFAIAGVRYRTIRRRRKSLQ